ncbi:post-GPI attachment to proteins factor 2-like [Frankliniella occidentalis]|uniref:Post-GPI attachment to proteins factor 2-like n=1 Tax=Frankliniella occidentalis TaxID=133901 RepID=A0A6J1TAN2_FRAOC|nr:post-GPI attachment to proteins factor 2-like [Frankliniella occidentalis]XP_026287786.1 post-GPI attachment to proteins factor 2-like [Frankliniella occidentalis]
MLPVENQVPPSPSRTVALLSVSFKRLCTGAVLLPLVGLLTCFITANIFQPDDIHETHCRVYNIIPSISAITGVSPQRYLWRICVAFHIGPRVLIAFVYYAHYHSIIMQRPQSERHQLTKHLRFCFWLSMIEIGTLCGCTYVSNRENYPLHEKIFIGFMISSLTYMLALVRLIRALQPDMTPKEFNSYQIKKGLFAVSIVSTIGLIVFFLKHRLLCHDMAFSWFAFCEYVVASCNMAYHFTVILDFPTEHVMVGKNGLMLSSDSNAEEELPTIHQKKD